MTLGLLVLPASGPELLQLTATCVVSRLSMAPVIILLLVVAHALSSDAASVLVCSFPDFLQSHADAEDLTTHRDWRTHWRQYSQADGTQHSSVSACTSLRRTTTHHV